MGRLYDWGLRVWVRAWLRASRHLHRIVLDAIAQGAMESQHTAGTIIEVESEFI